jgi:hypothetical protein
MQVAIVIPSGDMVHTDFAMSLVQLMSYTTMMTKDVATAIINPRSSMVQKGRWAGVKSALEINADKIMFIDSDQTFPADGLVRLLNHNKPVVGASYRKRQDEVEYTARTMTGEHIDFRKFKRHSGLYITSSNGLGFTLIDASVFKKMPEPWFDVSFEDGEWISEDESFCEECGEKIYIDVDLTMQIGHIGTKIY